MTDVATKNESDESSEPSATAAEESSGGGIAAISEPDLADATQPQWAPAAPMPKKRHLGLWIGVPAGVVAIGAVAASLILIAPGTAVAGVPVGFLTPGAATDAISHRLATTTISLGADGPTLTGADLGATVDAEALATAAYDERPLWNVTQWFGDAAPAEISLDPDTATAALRDVAPSLFTDPVGASVEFTGAGYEVTPAIAGEGIDLDVVHDALQQAFAAGETSVVVEPALAPVDAAATTELAQGTADLLNGMLEKIGFYVGDERTVPVAPETAASWLTVEAGADGEFAISADAAKIQETVDTLAPLVDQAPVASAVLANLAGTVLQTLTEGQDGRTLGDTSDVASAFAAQLESGNPVYELPVEVVPAGSTSVVRLLEVDLSQQRLYLKENDVVVDTWLISSGLNISPTYQGRYTVNSHIRSQTMRATDPDNPYWNYDVPNVEWVMYFNGNQAFHGIYWHNNFGRQMSHGCVGMPNWRAQQIYNWSANGTDVWIHA